MATEATNDLVNTFIGPFDLFVAQVISFLPKVIAAYVLWLIGNWLINAVSKLISHMDIKGMTLDDHVRRIIQTSFNYTAKFVLVLVILDTFGIGSNIIAAIINGLTFTVAIALGLAFGRALEPEAQRIVNNLRQYTQQKTQA